MTAFGFVGGRTPEHSRCETLAELGWAAAEERLGAFGRADRAIRANLLELFGRRDRSDLRLRIFRVADAQSLRFLRELFDETVVHSGLQQNARARLAALAGVVVDAVQRTGYGRVDIGVVKNDGRRFPAEFQSYALERARCGCSHDASRVRRTGKRDLIDGRMIDQPASEAALRTGDDVENAFGYARFECDLAQLDRRQGRRVRRLEHDRAACGERRCNLPRS